VKWAIVRIQSGWWAIAIFLIIWTFAQPASVGRFITGDWWVVGPVTVESVTPAPTADRHGSVVNPPAGDKQGYDGRLAHFDTSLRAQFPLRLKPGDSLVIASTMAFAHQMAPLILLTPALAKNAKGQQECSERFEIVIFNEGVIVWRHSLKEGKLAYRKAAFASFRLEKDTPYRLEVKKTGTTLTVSVAGHTFGYTDDALPDACYVGSTGCEGLNRFYDFSICR
jgi:hypothetical protein